MPTSSSINLDGKDYEVTRAKLRKWLQLEDIREKIVRAADRKDRDEFIAYIYSYLSVAFSVEIDFSILPWYEVVDAYADIIDLHQPMFEFPFLNTAGKIDTVSWDYEGRTWYAWSHILAEAYSWSLEYIEELEIDDAIAHLQEIATSEQMQKEWEWMLSEKSVSHDKQGKAKFHDLDRPNWMGDKKPKPELDRTPIKKSMLPVGNVLRWDDGKLDA